MKGNGFDLESTRRKNDVSTMGHAGMDNGERFSWARLAEEAERAYGVE